MLVMKRCMMLVLKMLHLQKRNLLLLLSLHMGYLACTDAPISFDAQSFVIKQAENKKKYSSNELKEKLGAATEEVFDATTDVVEQMGIFQTVFSQHHVRYAHDSSTVHASIGRIQQSIARVQRTCSSLVKKLVDNLPPFKKAKKPALQHALDTLITVREALTVGVQQIGSWCKTVANKAKAGSLKDSIVACEKKIVDACAMIQQDECLKDV